MEQLWPRYLHTPSKVNLTTLRIQPQPALSPLDVCALQLLSSGTPMPLSREHGHTCSTPFILRHLHPTHEDYADASERVLRLATITRPQARHHLSNRVKHFLERPSLKQGVRPRKHHHPTTADQSPQARSSGRTIAVNPVSAPSPLALKPHLHPLSESSNFLERPRKRGVRPRKPPSSYTVDPAKSH